MTAVDVLVVGSGASGLSAAIEAADRGSRVLVLESESKPGGSSMISGGMILAAGTDLQQRKGVADSADAFFHDYLMHTQWKVIPGLVRRIADESADSVRWLEQLGAEFYDELSDAGYDGVPRTHSVVGRGEGATSALLSAAQERGVEIRVAARVTALETSDERVVGVRVGDDLIEAGSTVLASGGFGANADLVKKLMPHTADTGDWMWHIGEPGARGDAIALTEEAGGQITGHGRGVTMLHPGFVRAFEGYQPAWMLLVNREGRRFGEETAPYGLMDGLTREHGSVVYAIFDDASRLTAAPGSPAPYKIQIPSLPGRPSPNWNSKMIDTMAAEGRIATADSIGALAERLGLPVDAFTGTVTRYNDLVQAGHDADYLKRPEFLRPIETGPFYGAELRPATVCLTAVGPRIDRNARVLSRHGRPIPGLFAAGECTGGTLGDRYVGTGNSWINCLVFGRVAGRTAASS